MVCLVVSCNIDSESSWSFRSCRNSGLWPHMAFDHIWHCLKNSTQNYFCSLEEKIQQLRHLQWPRCSWLARDHAWRPWDPQNCRHVSSLSNVCFCRQDASKKRMNQQQQQKPWKSLEYCLWSQTHFCQTFRPFWEDKLQDCLPYQPEERDVPTKSNCDKSFA